MLLDKYWINTCDDENARITWVRVEEGKEVEGLRVVLDALMEESMGMYPPVS